MASRLRYLAMAFALGLAGCGDGSDDPAATPTRTPVVILTPVPILTAGPPILTPGDGVVCIDGSPCPSATPTPAYSPAKATIHCFTIDRTPAGPCPTWTPTPTPADGIILEEVCELFGPLTPTVCRSPALFPTPRSRN